MTARTAEWIERPPLELLTRFDSELHQNNHFKLVFTQLPCLTLSIKGTVWRTSWQVYLLCVLLGKALSGISHVRVMDRWPATPKRARYNALIAFS